MAEAGSNKNLLLRFVLWMVCSFAILFLSACLNDEEALKEDMEATMPISMVDILPSPTLMPETETPLLTITPVPQIGSSRISEVDGMEMIYVPAGEFPMGSDEERNYASPVHTVYVDAFWIDKTEVTNGMYKACVAAGVCQELTPCYEPMPYGDEIYDNYPVACVTWEQADSYCRWAGRRLPYEAEWEKAARGTDSRPYSWGEEINCTLANYSDFSSGACVGSASLVGSYPFGASPYGVLDMTGNLSEWVHDLYADGYFTVSPYDNPKGPDEGNEHLLRGGSWNDSDWVVGTERRGWHWEEYMDICIGFRCAMDEEAGN